MHHTGTWLPPNLIQHSFYPWQWQKAGAISRTTGYLFYTYSLVWHPPKQWSSCTTWLFGPGQGAATQASWTAYAHEDIMFCAVLFGFFVVRSGVFVFLSRGTQRSTLFAMTPLDFAASEQVIIFIRSKNLGCRIVQQGNLAIPSPLPGISQCLKGSNSTQVSDSPWDQAFQQVRVPLRWIHCELAGMHGGSQCVCSTIGWDTAGSPHTPVSPHTSEQWHISGFTIFLLGIIIISYSYNLK